MGLFGSLFPEQTNILQHWHQVKSIGYSDENIAFETIFFSLLKACIQGEKSIIIIPDEESRQKFIHFLEPFHFDEICLNYNPDFSVTAENVLELQKKIAATKKSVPDTSYEEKNYVVSKLETEIHEVLSAFHEHDGDRNMQTVLERCRDVFSFKEEEMIHVVMNDLFPDLDEPSFDVFYDTILKASKLYSPSYFHIKTQKNYHISSHYTVDGEAVESFLNKLKHFIGELEQIRTQYYTFIEENINLGIQEINQQYVELDDLLNHIEFQCLQITNSRSLKDQSGILTLFSSKDKNLQLLEANLKNSLNVLDEKLSACKGFTKPYTSIHLYFKNLEKDTELLKNLKNDVTTWFSATKNSLFSNVKYSNVYNQKNKNQLQELEKTFFEIVEKINSESLFHKSIEVNTLSTQKQTELLNEFIQECTFAYNDVQENKGFYVWDAFYRSQDKWVQKSIVMLRNFNPDDWANIIEYSYLQKWVKDKISPRAHLLNDLIQKYDSERRGLIFSWWAQYKNQNKQRAQKIESFSAEQKLLYKNILQNKGLEKLNWRYFFENNTAFWGTFFDVVITNKDAFEDMKPGTFSNLFYLDNNDINPEVLHLGKTIHSYFKTDDTGTVSFDLTLANVSFPETIHIKKISSLEKFQKSKSLAYNFYSLQQKFQIFQLKNANIISCLSPLQNAFLKSYYQKEGMKEIGLGDSPMDRLIECLVESGRNPYLLIMDYVLNPLQLETLQAQLSVISSFTDFGFQVKVLSTQELVQDYNNKLNQFCKNVL